MAQPVDIYVTNPLSDRRWDDLVERHPRASAFHQRGWLQALAQTYGYEPFVLTTTPPGERLQNGVVLCRVFSWLTGNRLVSLPFADHCEPLLEQAEDFGEFANWLRAECDQQALRYVELRPRIPTNYFGLEPGQSYYLHDLDLTRSTEQLFRNLHKDSIQRKVRRAEKENLSCDTGCSARHVEEFCRLLLMTRRRHHLFPQPRSWFSNLVMCLGEGIQIRLAKKNGAAVAAMLTLRHGSSVIYKYGCSDEKFHRLGGMPFLFWRLIEESKAAGAEEIDFGRSDARNRGLVVFKDKLGAAKRRLTYYCYTNPERIVTHLDIRLAQRVVSILPLPDVVLTTSGRLLYKHLG
jgi:CelD/BcsL family acetyltransferase involved in cellulose biosynthesis